MSSKSGQGKYGVLENEAQANTSQNNIKGETSQSV